MSPAQKIGNFTILAKLGEGAESHIYAVQDSKTKQVWALKHVVREDDKDARFIEQVEREYEIGTKFDHPSLRTMLKLIRHRRMFKTHLEKELLRQLLVTLAHDGLERRRWWCFLGC